MVAQAKLQTISKAPKKRITSPIATATKVKARNLYVIQGLSAEEVAKAVGLTARQVWSLSYNYGWAGIRKRQSERLREAVSTREDALITEAGEAIADECQEIALSALQNAKAETTSPDPFAAKNFQAWTAGVRNLLSARSVVLNAEKALNSSDPDGKRSVNLFFFNMNGSKDKVATRLVTDIVATEAKQGS